MKYRKTRRRRRVLGGLGRLFGAGVLGAGQRRHPHRRRRRLAMRSFRSTVPATPGLPGYWDYRHNRYHWVSGHWVRERPGYYYSAPTWVQRGDRWVLTRGSWERGYRDRNAAWRDRDRDGIPNRYDRDRDNDGVRDRYDRDRDNDGVPQPPRQPSGQPASVLTRARPGPAQNPVPGVAM